MSGWYWPGDDDFGNPPDPVGFEEGWKPWPGTMQQGPRAEVEIFAREYLQNSWDSISEKLREVDTKGETLRPAVRFRFVRLEGAEAAAFTSAFGLDGFKSLVEGMDEEALNERVRLAEDSWVRSGGEAVDLLVASEQLGAGMFGSWEKPNDASADPVRMKLALFRADTGKTGEDTGGSWGKGKLGVAKASKSRVLAAYSCHPEKEGIDPEVSRRFMGVAYWGPHDDGDFSRAGLGLLGGNTPSAEDKWSQFRPLENDVADEFVEGLGVPGLEVRDPDESLDHGTSYLFVDPAFEPSELAEALARNWWPLLEQDVIDVEVIDRDGEHVPIDHRSIPALAPFLEAHDLAGDAPSSSNHRSTTCPVNVSGRDAGELKVLCSEAGAWSWDEMDEGRNADIVALVRNDMVIAYQQFPKRNPRPAPYLRGVFVVSSDEDVRRDLKRAEGHLHNSWIDDRADAKEEIKKFANALVQTIGNEVKALRDRMVETDGTAGGRVKAFDEILKLGRSRPSPGPVVEPGPSRARPWSIQEASNSERVASDDDPTKIKVKGQVKIALKPDYDGDEMEVRIDLGWGVVENGPRPTRDPLLSDASTIFAPKSFEKDEDGMLIGTLTKEYQSFNWESDWFPNDWRVAPDPRVEEIVEQPDSEDEE